MGTPASGCQEIRLKSWTKAGLGERSVGQAAELSGSQPHARDPEARELLRNPERAKLEGATLSQKSGLEVRRWSGILIASPFLQPRSSTQSTFLSFLRLGPLSPLEGGWWWWQEVSSLHVPFHGRGNQK